MWFGGRMGKSSWTVKSKELLRSQGIHEYPSYNTNKEG